MIATRVVILPDRVEWHTAACACRVPRSAEVRHVDRELDDIADADDEARELNVNSVVKPCLRKAAR